MQQRVSRDMYPDRLPVFPVRVENLPLSGPHRTGEFMTTMKERNGTRPLRHRTCWWTGRAAVISAR